MSEVDNDDNIELHFYKINNSNAASGAQESFFVFHPYLTQERALTIKWHVLKLKEGDYELKQLTEQSGNTHKTVNYKEGYRFSVKSGEAIFLGNLKLALKKTHERKFDSGTTIDIHSPFITSIEWDDENAYKELLKYKNYPKTLTRTQKPEKIQ